MTQYCVLSSQITSVGYVGNVICLKFAQESFKVLFEKELVKNMMYLVIFYSLFQFSFLVEVTSFIGKQLVSWYIFDTRTDLSTSLSRT